MKRLVFFVLFFILIINNTFAQSRFRYGVAIGGNYFSLRGSDLTDETQPKFGFSFGATVEYKITNKFSINSGFIIERKNIGFNSVYGYRNTDSGGNVIDPNIYVYESKILNTYKYFSVPLFFRYYIGKKNTFFTNLGVFSAHLQSYEKSTKREFKGQSQSNVPNSPDNFPLAGKFQGLDYGLSFGIGKVFNINKSNTLSIEIRDNYGLANTVERVNVYGVSGDINTDSLNLFVEWSFDIRNKKE